MTKMASFMLLASTALMGVDAGSLFSWGDISSDYLANPSTWNDTVAHPNASNTFNITGFDISAAFPANNTIEGWSAKIDVLEAKEKETGNTTAFSRISLSAPDSIDVPDASSNDSEWKYCVMAVIPTEFSNSVVKNAQKDNGSCSSFLSDECAEALRTAGDSMFPTEDSNGKFKCSQFVFPVEKCHNYLAKSDLTTAGFNRTNSITSNVLFSFMFDNKDGTEKTYDQALRAPWVVLVNWGRRDPQSWSTAEVLRASLFCLHAGNEESANSGAMNTQVSVLVMGLVLLASIMATL